MKNVSPPLKNYSAKVLGFFLLLLSVYVGRASNLTTSPTNSELTIIVANLSTGLLDKTIVGFNPLSTDTFNPVYDANKLSGMTNRETLYTLNGDQWMSINTLQSEATIDTVGMGFIAGSNATFTFTFSGISSFDSTSYIYLEDSKLHSLYNIRKGVYTFTGLTTDNWNRFILHFTPPVLVTGTNATCAATSTIDIQQPGMAFWNYKLTDNTNATVASGIVNQNQPVTLQEAPGTYKLTLIDSTGYVANKTIQVSAPQQITAVGFQVSDTVVKVFQPVTLSTAATSEDSTTGAITYQWNFDNGTTGTGVDTSISYAKPGEYNLGLTVTNQSGCSATQTQKITVTANPTTGFASLNNNTALNIWSNVNNVYVDFTDVQTVDAIITIYNVLGQEISNERFTNSSVYQKQFDNMPASYLIVKVKHNQQIFTQKVFVTNK